MRYVLAIAACFGLVFAWAFARLALGWEPGGIPKVIFVLALLGTWVAITRKKKSPPDDTGTL